MYSELPPSRMSVPRPAMLVAIVTAPLRPDCATVSLSLSTFSGFALSSCSATAQALANRPVPRRVLHSQQCDVLRTHALSTSGYRRDGLQRWRLADA